MLETNKDDTISFLPEFEVNMTHMILLPSFNFSWLEIQELLQWAIPPPLRVGKKPSLSMQGLTGTSKELIVRALYSVSQKSVLGANGNNSRNIGYSGKNRYFETWDIY